MAGELILITGSTGFIGIKVLEEALKKGYKVRAAVRSEGKIATVKATKVVQPYLANLSFIIVPDITVDGAFDEAVKDVDYILHVASPLPRPSNDLEATIIQPAIRGTLSILYSALKEPSIKRVVITSSNAAVFAPGVTELSVDAEIPDPSGPFPDDFVAYISSKVLAHNRTKDFIKKEKPKFNIINIMPSFVIGRNELATTKEELNDGSNRWPLIPILGHNNPEGAFAMSCHVDDVAFVHVAALDSKIQGNQNFGLSYGVNGIHWDEGLEVVKKHFPKEVESGIFPLGGSMKDLTIPFDTTHTEDTFGFRLKSYEDQIVSLAGQYAELAAQA